MSSEGEMPEGGLAGALALHMLGLLRAHEGRYEEAEAAFLRAAEAEPGMCGSYVELGLVYARQKQYAEMVGTLRRAVAVGPTGVRAYLAERPLGDISPAPDSRLSATSSGGRKEGEDVLPLVALAMSYLAAGRDEEASGVLEQVPGRKGLTSSAAVALLALAYLLRGESVEATGEGFRRGMSSVHGREEGAATR